MNFAEAFTRRKSGAPVSASSGYFGSGPTDLYGRTGSPSPAMLVREMLSTAYACMKLNADGVAATNLRLFVRTGKGEAAPKMKSRGQTVPLQSKQLISLSRSHASKLTGATEIEEVTSHPALDLLKRPNDVSKSGVGITGHALIWATVAFLDTIGRAYWYMQPDGGLRSRLAGGKKIPSELWILPSHYVTEVGTMGDKPIDYYQYSGPSKQQNYQTDEIAPFRYVNLNTGGYLDGMSPARAAFEQMLLMRQFDGHTNSILRNAGFPGAMWSPEVDGDGTIGPAEAQRMQSQFRRMFAQGNSGGVFVSPWKGKLTMLSYEPGKLMDPKQFEFLRASVAFCFQVPTSKLERNQTTVGGAQTGDYAHAVDAIIPRCRVIEAGLDLFFLSKFDDTGRLFFAFDNPAERYEVEELTRIRQGAEVGIVTVDEFRGAMGMPLLGGPAGAARYVAAGSTLIDDTSGMPMVPKGPTPVPGKPGKAMVREKIYINSSPAAVEEKTAGPHDYACLLFNLPKEHADQVLAIGKSIDEDDLAAEGRENDPHVTVKFGIHDEDPSRVRRLIDKHKFDPFDIVLGDITAFDENEDGGCPLKIDVASDQLMRLNKLITEEIPNTTTHAYSPHVTIAYVKPTAVDLYTGYHQLHGQSIRVDRLTLCGKDGGTTDIPLFGVKRVAAKSATKRAIGGDKSAATKKLIAAKMRKQFDAQREYVADALAKLIGKEASEDDLDDDGLPKEMPQLDDVWDDRAKKAMLLLLLLLLRDGYSITAADLDRQYGSETPAYIEGTAKADAAAQALDAAQQVNATTQRQLDEALDAARQAIEDGATLEEAKAALRKKVDDIFGPAADRRADATGEFEGNKAINAGALAAAKASKAVDQKAWRTNEGCCDACADLEAMGWIDLDDDFDGIDAPGLHPNCGCFLSFRKAPADDDD